MRVPAHSAPRQIWGVFEPGGIGQMDVPARPPGSLPAKINKGGDIMFCPNCGSNVPDGSPYCPTCGTPSRGQQDGGYHQESSGTQKHHQRKQSARQKSEADLQQQNNAEEPRQTGEQEETSNSQQFRQDSTDPYRQSQQDDADPYRQSQQDGADPYRQSQQDDADPYRRSQQDGADPYRQNDTGQYRQFHEDTGQTFQEGSDRYRQYRQQGAGSFQRQGYQQQYYQRPQPRTRLGITVGMLGAIIYFSALISPVILILLAVYVLMMEDNRWLKGSAIKCVVFYLVFFFIFQIIDGINYFLNIINRMIDFMVRWNPGFAFPGSVTDLLSIGQIAFFVIMGFGAFKMREIRIRKIDEFVETHI